MRKGLDYPGGMNMEDAPLAQTCVSPEIHAQKVSRVAS